ncbi:MAG: hypothetical protein HFF99_10145 [Oscillibacter sp.]|nr:hypothetical protein [uncultured Oscillibacter sp.]MCI8971811.1 hypothetical protein [Oscillibacter sp.]
MSCENCGGGCCSGCGQELLLTEAELALLRRLGETPFLPAAASYDRKVPVYLEDRERPREECAAAILGLAEKGLARLDYDIPLENFDYAAYRDFPLHGSVALTGRGQDVLEQIEIQGIEE